eukprot:c4007_g1_i2.p1 GENE.c4007_g1_i2~~c4007_g1_i2.p1  ORF type:complete len:345 (-),score=80.16 c4007_g1_i2:156-1190(-)
MPSSRADEKRVKREVEVLSHLHHPNIAAFIAAYEDPLPWYRRAPLAGLIRICFNANNPNSTGSDMVISALPGSPVETQFEDSREDQEENVAVNQQPAGCYKMYIVMELMEGDTLFEAVAKREKFHEGEARDVTKTIVEALAYLRSEKVVHRDIKPSNLVYSSNEPDATLKLVDFGASAFYRPREDGLMASLCGTLPFMAPEMFQGASGGGALYGEEVDMWALGVLVYMLLSGILPFDDSDPATMVRLVCDGDVAFPPVFWNHVSEAAVDFVKRCLTVPPGKRMTPPQALAHHWMLYGEHALDATLTTNKLRQNWASQRFLKVTLVLGALHRLREIVENNPTDAA